ncbi:TolC family protein [Avibacterium sp. 20-129]|uniref:TolC family protein n=1 Tax=Avibacterium sp. 20-129 TaxID=2911525 RepID=UPI0022472C35|nr:TolC family protein [Avibacterium sp. 20-129]MCW9700041.1 TolC family protein [Avibacterium sp. 20-129]
MKKSVFPLKKVQVLFLSLVAGSTWADSSQLQGVIRKAFEKDPKVLAAQANQKIANSKVKQAQAGHQPRLSVFAQQNMHQNHRYTENKSSKFMPGAQLSLNLYSFGAVEKRVKQTEKAEQTYRYKIDETQETLGYTITELYLMALRASETLNVLRQSLVRIDNILNDIDVIADYDEGRRSEFVQAQARKYAIEQQINSTERELKTMADKLKRYSGRSIDIKKISDPFNGLNTEKLVAKYSSDKNIHPTIQVSNSEIEDANAELEARKAERLPKLDLIGQATRDDQVVYLNMSWDVYNPESAYQVQERAERLLLAESNLEQANLDIEERKSLALLNLSEYQTHIKTLNNQIKTQEEVIEFYKLQFLIAKRTLLELLNAENELLSAQLSKVNSEYQLRHSVLDYLSSQGTLRKWVNGK